MLAGFDSIAFNRKRLVPLNDDDFKTFELEPKHGLLEYSDVSLPPEQFEVESTVSEF